MAERSGMGPPQAVKRNDREAFKQLRDELEPAIRRFTHRLIGPFDGVDDIVQDAFVALYVNCQRIRPEEGVRPFLYRIVRNLCYDELRRRGRFSIAIPEPYMQESPLDTVPDHRPGPDETVQWMMLYSEVQQAMDRLPELQRQVLILSAEEGLSHDEIATAMSVSKGTVKSRLYHARKNLARLLRSDIRLALGLED